MANNNKMTTANVDGMYIYRDEKGRAIYSMVINRQIS